MYQMSDKVFYEEIEHFNDYFIKLQQLIGLLCMLIGILSIVFSISLCVYLYNYKKTDKKLDNLLAYHAMEDTKLMESI